MRYTCFTMVYVKSSMKVILQAQRHLTLQICLPQVRKLLILAEKQFVSFFAFFLGENKTKRATKTKLRFYWYYVTKLDGQIRVNTREYCTFYAHCCIRDTFIRYTDRNWGSWCQFQAYTDNSVVKVFFFLFN